MKLIIVLLFGLFPLAFGALLRGETLSRQEVIRRWGSKAFSVEAFKLGVISQRAGMAADLISKKAQFVGKKAPEIRTLLGDFSGHYFSESYPTYLIQKGDSSRPESWQLVFVIDRNGQVTDIVVHKNCCY